MSFKNYDLLEDKNLPGYEIWTKLHDPFFDKHSIDADDILNKTDFLMNPHEEEYVTQVTS